MELVLPQPRTQALSDVESRGTTKIAVVSGKGGVGKTTISTNLATALASRRLDVLLMDCDLSAGQVHVLLGLSPSSGLAQVATGDRSVREILVEARQGLCLAPGGPSDGLGMELQGSEVIRLVAEAHLAMPCAHAIVLDAGPGRISAAPGFVRAVDVCLVLSTPEPTAVRATVALLEAVCGEEPTARPLILVNMASTEEEGEATFRQIRDALLPVFQAQPAYWGSLPCDPAVPRSLRRYRPFVVSEPTCRAARGLCRLTETLCDRAGMRVVAPPADPSAEGEDLDAAGAGREAEPAPGERCSDDLESADDDDGEEARAA